MALGAAAITGIGTNGATGTTKVAVSDRSKAIKAGAGIGGDATFPGPPAEEGAITAIASGAAIGSGLAMPVGMRSADGSIKAGAAAVTCAGTSTTRRSSASKRLSRQGKPKPGSPNP